MTGAYGPAPWTSGVGPHETLRAGDQSRRITVTTRPNSCTSPGS